MMFDMSKMPNPFGFMKNMTNMMNPFAMMQNMNPFKCMGQPNAENKAPESANTAPAGGEGAAPQQNANPFMNMFPMNCMNPFGMMQSMMGMNPFGMMQKMPGMDPFGMMQKMQVMNPFKPVQNANAGYAAEQPAPIDPFTYMLSMQKAFISNMQSMAANAAGTANASKQEQAPQQNTVSFGGLTMTPEMLHKLLSMDASPKNLTMLQMFLDKLFEAYNSKKEE